MTRYIYGPWTESGAPRRWWRGKLLPSAHGVRAAPTAPAAPAAPATPFGRLVPCRRCFLPITFKRALARSCARRRALPALDHGPPSPCREGPPSFPHLGSGKDPACPRVLLCTAGPAPEPSSQARGGQIHPPLLPPPSSPPPPPSKRLGASWPAGSPSRGCESPITDVPPVK